LAGGDWEVRFRRTGPGRAETIPSIPAKAPCQAVDVELDARGLEPPQPMVKIFEALAVLPAGATLHARMDRRPMHLFPKLEARGFRADCAEQPGGGFLTVIRHA